MNEPWKRIRRKVEGEREGLEGVVDLFRNFRGGKLRDKQIKAIELMEENAEKFNIISNLPTGTGKSLIGMMWGKMNGKTAYLCSSKQLQDQLIEEFPEAKSIKGRSNYTCIEHGGDCSGCVHSNDNPCCSRNSCVYQIEKQIMYRNDIQVMNYDFFLSIGNFTPDLSDNVGVYDLIICDEADVLEQKLTDFVTVEISRDIIKRLGLIKPDRVSSGAKNVQDIWTKWAKDNHEKVEEFIEFDLSKSLKALGVEEGSKDWEQKVLVYTGLEYKLRFLKNNVTKDWLFEENPDKFVFKPLWLNVNIFKQIMGRFGKKFLFMSGSLPKKEIFCGLVGLRNDESFYMQTASAVPVENRQIYCDYLGSMSKKNQDLTLPKIIDKVNELMDKYEGQRGVVHTVSFALEEKIIDGLSEKNKKRVLTAKNSNDKVRVVNELKESVDKVFFSPSSSRGLDLPDDECRFIIIAKCPFGYLGDKLISSRFYSGKFGKDWYAEQAAQDIIQMMGRGIRGSSDYADTWILDSDVKNVMNRKFFPQWILDGRKIVK